MGTRRGRELFNLLEKTFNLLSSIIKIFPMRLRIVLFNFFRDMNGLLGIGIRFIFIKSIVENCGKNVSIHRGVYLLRPEKLSLGDNVSIHPMCYIDASGGITIKSDVSIAHSTTILSTSHSYEDHNYPIKEQPIVYKETVIEENVWVGSKATILCGVVIESGSIIGACSLVNKSVSKNQIVAGIPAKKIKNR